MRTQLIKPTYFNAYKQKQPITLAKHLAKLRSSNRPTFGYSVSLAAVHSSMIEGNPIDFDSYLNYTETGMNTKSKSYLEIRDLISAYEFAMQHPLTLKNFLKAHELLARTTVGEKKYRGTLRDRDVYIFSSGKKIFTGIEPALLPSEMDALFNDIAILLQRKHSLSQAFYYASMLHLVLVQIHPFADGNGRAARLLEKWFLSGLTGERVWLINSEKLYQKRIKQYYRNVNLGSSYNSLNYALCTPFLLMLPMALRIK